MAKYLIVFFTLIFAAPVAALTPFFENGKNTHQGPDAAMFAETPYRQKIDLAGKWEYSTDGIVWQPVLVPSAYDFAGTVTFQRTFSLSGEMLDRYVFFLVAYGINYQSEISINGVFITRHTGGYTSFVVPIDGPLLQVGDQNVIRIVVDNVLTARTTVPLRQRVGGWRNYGGIFRDIYLLAVPKIFIGETEVQADVVADFKTARIRVQSLIENRGYSADKPGSGKSGFAFIVELYDKLSGVQVIRTAAVPINVEVSTTVPVNVEFNVPSPKLWSPAAPDLYVVKCFIVYVAGKEIVPLDEFDLNIGIRSVRFKDSALMVNGTTTMLKGVVWREDHPVFGSAMTYEAMEKDIAQIKGLGANAIRFLYPPHPYLLNLCDRYGVFALVEIPNVDAPAQIMLNEEYQEAALNYTKEMILRDRHHASVLAWGVGDNTDFAEAAFHDCNTVKALHDAARALDNRPVYYVTSSLSDTCLERFPLLALNTFTQQAKELRQIIGVWKESFPTKPLIVARYGKAVQPGNRNGYSDPLSLEAQARYAMQHFEVLKELKVVGSLWWSFSDWRGDRPSLSTYSGDPYLYAQGLVSYEREKRTAYDVLRASFHGEKIAALPIGNYSSTAPMIFVIAGLIVLIAFAFFYNSNRRFRENVHRGLTRTYNFFADVRDQRILTYSHSLFLALIIAMTWAIVLSSILAHYRDNRVFDNLLSQFFPDSVKEWIVLLVWDPTRFIPVLTGIIFTVFLLLSLIIQFFAVIARARTHLYHAISVAVWSMLPYIVLIPIAIVLYRILETPFYILPSFLVIGVLVVWTTYRFLKGISVIFDAYPLKVYTVGIIIIVGSLALLYGYLDYTQSTSIYLRHLISEEITHVLPLPA